MSPTRRAGARLQARTHHRFVFASVALASVVGMLTAWDMISSIRFMACTAAGCGYTSTTPGGGYTQPIQTAPSACVPTGQFCFAGSTCCEGSCLPYEPNMGICGPSETVPTPSLYCCKNGMPQEVLEPVRSLISSGDSCGIFIPGASGYAMDFSDIAYCQSAPEIPVVDFPDMPQTPVAVPPSPPAVICSSGCQISVNIQGDEGCPGTFTYGGQTVSANVSGAATLVSPGKVSVCISTKGGVNINAVMVHESIHAAQYCQGQQQVSCQIREAAAFDAVYTYLVNEEGMNEQTAPLSRADFISNGVISSCTGIPPQLEQFIAVLSYSNPSVPKPNQATLNTEMNNMCQSPGGGGAAVAPVPTPAGTPSPVTSSLSASSFGNVGNTSSGYSEESICPPPAPPSHATFPQIKQYVDALSFCSTQAGEESSSSAGAACFACFYQDIACDTLSVQNCGKIKPAGADWASDCVVRGNACVNTFKQDCDAAVAAAPESPRAASFAGTQLRDVFREDCTQRRYQVEGHGTPGMLPQVVRQISMCAGGCAPGTTSAITINSCSVFQNVNTAQVYMQSIVNQYPQATFTVTGYMNPTAPGNPGASVTFCAAGQSSSVSVQFGPCHTQSNVCYIQNGVATATTRCTDENGAAKWETCCAVTKPFTPLTGQPGVSAGEYYRGDSTNVNCPAQSTTPAYCNFGGGCYGTAPGTTQSCSPANYYGSGTPAPVSRVCCMKVAHTYQEWMPGTTCPSLLCAPDGTGCLDNTKPACRSSEFVSTPDKVQLCCFNSGSTAGTTIVADSADEACPASCGLGTSYCSSEGKTVQCVNGTRLSYQTCCSVGDGTRDLKWYIEGRCPMGGAPVQASSASSTPAPVTSACNATSPAPTQKSCTVKDMINTSQWPWTVAANTQCLNNGSASEERCCSVLKPGAPSVTLEWTMVPQGGSCPALNLPFCQFSKACQGQGGGSAQCLLGLSVKNRLCCQQFADDPTKKVWKEPVNGACPALNANACKSPANITDLRSPLLVNTCTKSQFLTTTTCQDPGTLGTPTTESCCKRIVDSEEYVWIRSSVSGCPAALPAYCPAIDSACLSDARKINGCSQKNGNTITGSAVICCQNQDPAAAGTPAAQLHWLSGSACPANYKKRATVNLPAVTLEDTQSTCPAASANVSTLIRNAWTAASGNCVNQGGTIYPTSIGTAASACTMGTPQSQGWWWSPTCKARAQCTFVCANALVPYSQN